MEKLLVPLDGKNWCTWKIQVRMMLMSLNLWDLVQGTATLAQAAEAAVAAEFRRRVTRALFTIVLAVSPSLLYFDWPRS